MFNFRARGKVFVKGTNIENILPELAPSTILAEDINKRDVFGITVSYAVRIKVTFGNPVFGEAILDLPIVLDNPHVVRF